MASAYIYNDTTSETGGVFLAPRPGPDNSMPKPEFATRPFFGVEPVLLDSNVSFFQHQSMCELYHFHILISSCCV